MIHIFTTNFNLLELSTYMPDDEVETCSKFYINVKGVRHMTTFVFNLK
jgi:hypothetical protein